MKNSVCCVNEKCPHYRDTVGDRGWIRCFGSYRRKCDSKIVQRFRCIKCLKTFSNQTFNPNYRQHKPRINKAVRDLICSKVSLRRIAILLSTNRKTVIRKFHYNANLARLRNKSRLQNRNQIDFIQIDEMETFEHSKCKPLSIALAVEPGTRLILGAISSEMPAKGPLAEISRKKYGPRPDGRRVAFQNVLTDIRPLLSTDVWIVTDKKTAYPAWIKSTLPQSVHLKVKGKRGCVAGYGEMKKTGFDPLFWLNHNAAMVRDNLARMLRRTWCTTKKIECLQDALALYTDFHNEMIEKIGAQKLDRQEYLLHCQSHGLLL